MTKDNNIIVDSVKLYINEQSGRATISIGKELLKSLGIKDKKTTYKLECNTKTGTIILTPLKPTGLENI